MDPSITIWHAGSKGPSMKDDLTMESGHREGSMKQRPLRIPFKKYDVHSAAKGEGVTGSGTCSPDRHDRPAQLPGSKHPTTDPLLLHFDFSHDDMREGEGNGSVHYHLACWLKRTQHER